jgi:cellulose synthase/poly-beta-1,6-N-acetylglucosamine synthase-like glycosyltransferase
MNNKERCIEVLTRILNDYYNDIKHNKSYQNNNSVNIPAYNIFER